MYILGLNVNHGDLLTWMKSENGILSITAVSILYYVYVIVFNLMGVVENYMYEKAYPGRSGTHYM